MGIDTDWNCAISLRPLEDCTQPDPHRMTSDYADWDVKVRRFAIAVICSQTPLSVLSTQAYGILTFALHPFDMPSLGAGSPPAWDRIHTPSHQTRGQRALVGFSVYGFNVGNHQRHDRHLRRKRRVCPCCRNVSQVRAVTSSCCGLPGSLTCIPQERLSRDAERMT